jgi:hypothetical protein
MINRLNVFGRLEELEKKVADLEVRVRQLEILLEELRTDFGNWKYKSTEDLLRFDGRLDLTQRTLRRTIQYIEANKLVEDAQELNDSLRGEHKWVSQNTALVQKELRARGVH